MIRPRLAGEIRKLLRRIVPGLKRPDLIHAPREGPVRERSQVNLGVYRDGPHVDCRPGERDLRRIGPVFRNAQGRAAGPQPIVQHAELNEGWNLLSCVNTVLWRVALGDDSLSGRNHTFRLDLQTTRRSLYGTAPYGVRNDTAHCG